MQTILITGSDTGIGKTTVAATIGKLLHRPNLRIQFIKPVETGIAPEQSGDAASAKNLSGIDSAEIFTLLRFSNPIAPISAAKIENRPFSLSLLIDKWHSLPPADLRIVEGAGGIAVPLDESGADWTDFAREIHADNLILVIPDRLGAINQALLTHSFANAKNLRSGIWLNETSPQPESIRQSNRDHLRHLLTGSQRFNQLLPENSAESLRLLSK